MTTLYATDLDGTLLDADACLSPGTVSIFNSLTVKGVKIAFVTSRTPATVEPITSRLSNLMPSVVMTGAAIWDFASRSYLQVHYHNPADALVINDIFLRHGVGAFAYTLPRGTNTLHVYHPCGHLTDIERSFVKDRTLNDLKTFHLHTPMPAGAERCTVLFFAMGDAVAMQKVADDVNQATSCHADWYPDTYHPGLALLEIFAHGVSKASGLAELRHISGADRVVAFGDNLNDMPMLRTADLSVAVANAHPQVREAADELIGPNTDDSVIRYIARDSGHPEN